MIFDTRAISGIGRFRISAAQTDESIALLAKFRRAKRFTELLRDRRGDRAAADRNASAENFAGFDEKQVGRPRADIDEQRATAQLAVVVTKRVVERHRRDIHDLGSQPAPSTAALIPSSKSDLIATSTTWICSSAPPPTSW